MPPQLPRKTNKDPLCSAPPWQIENPGTGDWFQIHTSEPTDGRSLVAVVYSARDTAIIAHLPELLQIVERIAELSGKGPLAYRADQLLSRIRSCKMPTREGARMVIRDNSTRSHP